MTETVDQATGDGPPQNPRDLPEPLTLEHASRQLCHLKQWLSKNADARVKKLRELEPVQNRYNAVYNAALLNSERTEAALRKAEAEMATRAAHMPDDELPLAERLSQLKLELKVLDTLGHDVRAVMNALQTVSKNLQADAFATGRQI